MKYIYWEKWYHRPIKPYQLSPECLDEIGYVHSAVDVFSNDKVIVVKKDSTYCFYIFDGLKLSKFDNGYSTIEDATKDCLPYIKTFGYEIIEKDRADKMRGLLF